VLRARDTDASERQPLPLPTGAAKGSSARYPYFSAGSSTAAPFPSPLANLATRVVERRACQLRLNGVTLACWLK